MIHSGGAKAKVAFSVCTRYDRADRHEVVGNKKTYAEAVALAKALVDHADNMEMANYIIEVHDETGETVWMREKITNYEDQ